MTKRTCVICGRAFPESTGPGRPRIKCLACGPRYRDRVAHAPGSCRTCGAGLTSNAKRYCSETCKYRAKPRIPCSSCGQPSGWLLSQAGSRVVPTSVKCRPCRRRANPRRPKRVGPKLCAVCSCVIPNRRKYCDPCRDAKQGPWQRRSFTDAARERQRQYRSPEHKAERRRVADEVEAGEAFCWRCGQHIPPGSPFHLGHDDDDRSVYRGAECPECNLRAAARKGRRMQHAYKEAS